MPLRRRPLLSSRRLALSVTALVVALAGAFGDLSRIGLGQRGSMVGGASTAEAATLGQWAGDLPVLRKKKRRGGSRAGPAPSAPPTQPAPPSQPAAPPAPSATAPAPSPPEAVPSVIARSCVPRPPIGLRAEPALLPEPGLGLPGRDALLVTLSTSGTGLGIRKIGFQTLSNAVVTIGDGQPHTAPFSLSFPQGQQPAALQFALWRPDQSQGSWLRLSIVDGCGEWATFTGRGPGA